MSVEGGSDFGSSPYTGGSLAHEFNSPPQKMVTAVDTHGNSFTTKHIMTKTGWFRKGLEAMILVAAIVLIFTVMYPADAVAQKFGQFFMPMLLASVVSINMLDMGDNNMLSLVLSSVATAGGLASGIAATIATDSV